MTKLRKRLCCARTTTILGKIKRINIKKKLLSLQSSTKKKKIEIYCHKTFQKYDRFQDLF